MYELASGPITGLPRLVWYVIRTNYGPAADPAPPIPTFRMFLTPAINYEPSAQRSMTCGSQPWPQYSPLRSKFPSFHFPLSIVVPNVFLYNTMISELARARKVDLAMELPSKMKVNGL